MNNYDPLKDLPQWEALPQQYMRIINSLLYDNNELASEVNALKIVNRELSDQVKMHAMLYNKMVYKNKELNDIIENIQGPLD